MAHEQATAQTEQYNTQKRKKPKKFLANIKSPIIDAILNGHYVFSSREQAEKKLEYVQSRFVRSSYGQEEEVPRTILWIRGYDVTEEEEATGCIGNYAIIYIDEQPGNSFTLAAQKVVADAKRHPQRRRKKNRHPDWGYWVLRRIKKGWRYDSIDEAYSDLMTLAEDFPDVTIPSQNKVFTILYQRSMDEEELPLKRVILEVEALHEGGFTVTCKPNNYKPKETKAKKVEAEPKAAMGRFTSMVQVKQNRRKNIADFKPAQPEEDSE